MQIKTIIFDFDGVIADTQADIAGAVQAAQKHFNVPVFDLNTISPYIGYGAKYLIDGCFPSFDESGCKEALTYYKNYYMDHCIVETTLYPGVKETLEKLNQKGIRMAIVSNKPEELVVKICGQLGIDKLFTRMYGPESLTNMKPDPEGLLKFLEITGDSPAHAMMAGDTYTDIQAGKNAGCHTCGVLYGIGDTEKLLAENADCYIHSMDELFRYIGE